MGANILVTGGAGYIGSHCCKLLARRGYTPVCYDNFSSGRRDAVRYGPLVEGDIRDAACLRDAFAQYAPACVMHFAALIDVEESVRLPALYRDVNVDGTKTLLEVGRDFVVERFVFSSTAGVYGAPAQSPVGLDAAPAPINPYGETKLAAEKLIASHAGETGMVATIFRYFNAAGADPDGELGMRIVDATHLIPRLLAAAADDSVFSVFGDDYPTPDGTCVRDYIHVCDLATAHVAALERDHEAGSVATYNLGVGRGYSVREVIASVERVTGKMLKIRMDKRRSGDAPSLVAGDTDAVRAALGWQPVHTGIDDIVGHGAAWLRADRLKR